MTRQVVTIQVGNQANYIASHFWNLQQAYQNQPAETKELDATPFFREATETGASNQPPHHPRTQVIDATSAFGSYSTQNGQIVDPMSMPAADALASEAWNAGRQVIVRDSVPPCDLHALENDELHSGKRSNVKFWSDFLMPDFHHRACHALAGVHHEVSNLSHFTTGVEIATVQTLDDLYNDLRFFIEECDSLGGLVLLTNADDAFAGLASSYIRHLSQELGSAVPALLHSAHARARTCSQTSATSLGLPFDRLREERMSRNEAALLYTCMEHGVQYTPISTQAGLKLPGTCLGGLDADRDAYRSTACLGLVLDAALSPLCTRESVGGLLAPVRPRGFALYSSLYANLLPDGLARSSAGTADAVLQHAASVNVSDMWGSRGGSLGVRDGEHFLSARGFEKKPSVGLNTEWGIPVPWAFPAVLECLRSEIGAGGLQTGLQRGVSGLERVSVVAGLAFDRDATVAGLRGLSESLDRRVGLSKADVMDVVDVGEIQECFRSHVEDIVDT